MYKFLQKNVTAFVLLLYIFSLVPIPLLYAKENCAALVQKIVESGKIHEPDETYLGKFTNERFKLQNLLLYDPKALYIGIANGQNIGSHHFYFIFENTRIDGKIPGMDTIKSGKKEGNPPLADIGIIFKLDIDDMTAEKLRTNLNSSSFHLSCLHSLCARLKKGGISLIPDGEKILPSTVAHQLITNEVMNRNPSIKKITILHANPNKTVEKYLSDAISSDTTGRNQLRNTLAVYSALIGSMGVLIAPVLYTSISNYFKDDDKKKEKGKNK